LKQRRRLFIEFEIMSVADVTDQYSRHIMTRSEWPSRLGFIAGARSLNEESLRKNLQAFNIPQAGIEASRSKLTMKILDEYANIFRGMYNGRFNLGLGTLTD
jgi:hypothetical protein